MGDLPLGKLPQEGQEKVVLVTLRRPGQTVEQLCANQLVLQVFYSNALCHVCVPSFRHMAGTLKDIHLIHRENRI